MLTPTALPIFLSRAPKVRSCGWDSSTSLGRHKPGPKSRSIAYRIRSCGLMRPKVSSPNSLRQFLSHSAVLGAPAG